MLGFGIVLLIILFLNYLKDIETAKRFKRFENSVEDLHKKVYRLQQMQSPNLEIELDKVEALIEDKVKKDLEDVAIPLADAIHHIKESIQTIQNKVEHKSEERSNMHKESLHDIDPDDTLLRPNEDIVELYKQGYSEKEISRELSVGQEQVELTLKINGLK
jgi:DNA-binding NarL/FixJ family response regulator